MDHKLKERFASMREGMLNDLMGIIICVGNPNPSLNGKDGKVIVKLDVLFHATLPCCSSVFHC